MDYQKVIQETQKKHNVKWPRIWLICPVVGENVESFNFLYFLHFRWYWKVSAGYRWRILLLCAQWRICSWFFLGSQKFNRRPKNPCEKNPCSHLCLLSHRHKIGCKCPKGLSLLQDGRTCNTTSNLLVVDHSVFYKNKKKISRYW